MQDKIKILIQEILTLHKETTKPFRKTIYPKVVEIANTSYEDQSLISLNQDTNFTLDLKEYGQYFKIVTDITSKENATTQLFYKKRKMIIFLK